MKKDDYMKEIEKRLHLPRQAKKEVLRDLEEAFASAAEHGETEEQVIRRFGSPEEFVKSLDEQLGFERFAQANRKRKRLLSIVLTFAFSMVCFMAYGIHKTLGLKKNIEGIIGGADGPTAILVTSVGPDISLWLVLGVIGLIAAVILIILYVRKYHGKNQ